MPVSEDLAPSSLPDESPQLGDGTAMKAQQQAYAQAGSPSAGGASSPPQGASPPPGEPQTPVQPGPQRTPLNQNDMRPGGPVFMQPQTSPAPSWRQQLRTWANHPEARVIRQLSQRADAGLKTKPPDQQ